MIGDSPDVLDALRRLGGTDSLADAYLAATFGILALIAAGYAVQAVLRLRGEETGGRAEPLLATAVSRTRWALSHVAIALAGTAAAARGRRARPPASPTPPRPATRASSRDCSAPRWRRCPAAWVLAGRRAGALRPRAEGDDGGLGRARALPRAGRARPGARALARASSTSRRSRTAHSSRAAAFSAAPLALAAIAAALGAAGLAGLRRRDLAP